MSTLWTTSRWLQNSRAICIASTSLQSRICPMLNSLRGYKMSWRLDSMSSKTPEKIPNFSTNSFHTFRSQNSIMMFQRWMRSSWFRAVLLLTSPSTWNKSKSCALCLEPSRWKWWLTYTAKKFTPESTSRILHIPSTLSLVGVWLISSRLMCHLLTSSGPRWKHTLTSPPKIWLSRILLAKETAFLSQPTISINTWYLIL